MLTVLARRCFATKVKTAPQVAVEAAVYPLQQALRISRALSHVRFDESVRLSLKLGIDPRKPNQNIRGVAKLPFGIGKPVKVAVFAKGDKALEARNAGADIVGDQDLADKIQEGKIDFERLLATPDMMHLVGKLARILGPRGLMPNPKLGTMTVDVGEAVKSQKQGQVQFKSDKFGTISTSVGRLSFSDEQLVGNISSFIATLNELKPSGAKANYIQKCTLSSAMGPAVLLDLRHPPFRASGRKSSTHSRKEVEQQRLTGPPAAGLAAAQA